jgi:hypothetical protein
VLVLIGVQLRKGHFRFTLSALQPLPLFYKSVRVPLVNTDDTGTLDFNQRVAFRSPVSTIIPFRHSALFPKRGKTSQSLLLVLERVRICSSTRSVGVCMVVKVRPAAVKLLIHPCPISPPLVFYSKYPQFSR